MDHALHSFTIDPNDQALYGPNNFYHQQKEIDGVLSTAFNDLNNLSEDDLCDDGLDSNQNYLTEKVNIASTLLRTTATEENGLTIQHHVGLTDDYAKLESDCEHLTNLSLSDLDIYETKKSSDGWDNCEYQNQCKNYVSQDNCQVFSDSIATDLSTIDKLNCKIKLLEKQLKDEREAKDNMYIKSALLESKVQTLEYELKETHEIDFVARTSEKQAKAIETLRLKYQKELSDLRGTYESKIESLTQQLNTKEEEILSYCDLIEKYKQEANHYKKTILWNQDTAGKVKNIVTNAKKETELKLLHSFDQSVERIKQEWKVILHKDVRKIVDWFEQDSNLKHTSTVNLEFHFKEIFDLFTFLQQAVDERESQISAKIHKFEEAKQQLERVLLESKLRNSSLSSSSSRSDRLDDLKNSDDHLQAKAKRVMSLEKQQCVPCLLPEKCDKELTKLLRQYQIDLNDNQHKLALKEEECQQLIHKLNKYKHFCITNIKKHKEEVIQLSKGFSSIIKEIQTQKSSN